MNQRNQTLELFKLFASIFVVFIHITLPGNFGTGMNCLARFAVPFFFAVSGYFCFQTREKRILKRAAHIFTLLVGISLLYFATEIFYILRGSGGSVSQALPELTKYLHELISLEHLSYFLLFSKPLFNSTLWFLAALFLVYLLLFAYTYISSAIKEPQAAIIYEPLYLISAVLLVFLFVFTHLDAILDGIEIPRYFYRNTLFTGLPCFVLGLFIRQHQDKLQTVFSIKRCVGFFLLGGLLSLAECFGFAAMEIYAGSVLMVLALLLLSVSHPHLTNSSRKERLIALAGKESTILYLLHPYLYYEIVRKNTESVPLFSLLLDEKRWLLFAAVILLCLMIGVIWCLLSGAVKALAARLR